MSDPDPLIHRAAEAVADRVPVDWDQASARLSARAQRDLLENLRDIHGFAQPIEEAAKAGAIGDGTHVSWFVSLIALVATLQIVVALIGFASVRTDNSEVPAVWQLALVSVFAIAGLGLVVGGRRDRRAILLGTFYLVAATSFAQRFIGRIAGWPRPLWASLYLETLSPYVLWRFVQAFPRVERFSRDDRRASWAALLALIVGLTLFALNLAVPLLTEEAARVLAPFTRSQMNGSVYWAIISALTLSALIAAPFRARLAAIAERRRVAWFLLCIGFGAAPLLIELVLEVAVPSLALSVTPREFVSIMYPFVSSIPVTTAYAVMVERVVDVSFVVKRALQYTLAKAAVLVLTIVPLVLLAQLGVSNRNLTIGELIGLPVGRALLGVALVGLVLLLTRDRLLARIDRAFRKKTPPLDQAVATLTGNIRDAVDARELTDRIEPIFDEMLGTSRSAALTLNQDTAAFEPSRRGWRPLPVESGIVALLGDDDEVIDVGRDERSGVFHLLPGPDREWIVSTRCAILSPLRGRTGELLGILALGPKDSGLPFDKSDAALLRGMSGPIALVLDQILQSRNDHRADDGQAASECLACGAVLPGAVDMCACGGRLRTAALPAQVARKFIVERRLGAGAMGTAYLARDLTLQRPVVIKALPRRVAGAARLLEGEARAMARVSDSRLALIFGVETWRGAPLLVMEYLAGGTLADRIKRHPLTPYEALAMGSTLAGGLQVLHDTGVLHRDVKPTNIAFSAEGAPKLLDFGLSSLIDDSDDPSHLAGTPLYLAPELMSGGVPGPASDLWSLSLVLYESIVGRNPFASVTVSDALRLVAAGRVPDLRTVDDSIPAAVCDLFSTLLARDPSARPASAADMIARLDAVVAQIE